MFVTDRLVVSDVPKDAGQPLLVAVQDFDGEPVIVELIGFPFQIAGAGGELNVAVYSENDTY